MENRTKIIEPGIAGFASVSTGLLLIILCNGLGAERPPVSIFCTLFLLPMIIGGINRPLYEFSFNLTVGYNFALLLINDRLLRLYAVGPDGDTMKDWIALSFAAAFGLSFIVMIVQSFQLNRQQLRRRTFHVLDRCMAVAAAGGITALIYVAAM